MPFQPNQHIVIKCALHLMKQWPFFMDGIDRIFGFWPDKAGKTYQGMEWLRHKQDEMLNISADTQTYLLNEAKSNKGFQWLSAKLLPFISQEQTSIGQLDLFTESNYLVLHVNQRIDSNNSPAHFYLFFRDNKSNFGISESKESYSTSEKVIIGRLAKNFAHNTVSNYLHHVSETIQFRETTQKLLRSRQYDINQEKEDFSKWNNYWVDDYLNILSERDGFNYVIKDEVKNKLLNKCNNLHQLKDSIENSLVYICNLYNNEPGDTVELELPFLIIETTRTAESNSDTNLNSRLSKTSDLLDRLEKSALKVLDTSNSLTSAEVGKNMDRAITAPAISDALKKNKVRILQLLSQYPNRWPTIRKHFKPVVNLYEKNKHNISNTS